MNSYKQQRNSQKLPLIFITLCYSVGLSQTVFAANISENLSLNGFVNQGYFYSDDNPYAGLKNGSFEFRELILNGNWQVSEKLRLSGQVMNKTVGEVIKAESNVDFLLMDYQISHDQNSTIGVRLGRIKTPFGLYNSARDIPTTRPGVFVPQSTYFESSRDLLISSDGINLYMDLFNKIGGLHLEVFAGSREVSDSQLKQYSGDFEGRGSYDNKGFSVNFVPDSEHDLSFNVSLLDSTSAVKGIVPYAGPPTYAVQNLNTKIDFKGVFKIASVQYGYQDWLFTAEYLLADTVSSIDFGFPGPSPSSDIQSEGYFIQAEWFANPKLSALLRYDTYYTNTDDRDGSESATVAVPAYRYYAKGLTVGGRWFISSGLTLTAEYSQNSGTATLPVVPGQDLNGLDKDWSLASVELTYQF